MHKEGTENVGRIEHDGVDTTKLREREERENVRCTDTPVNGECCFSDRNEMRHTCWKA